MPFNLRKAGFKELFWFKSKRKQEVKKPTIIVTIGDTEFKIINLKSIWTEESCSTLWLMYKDDRCECNFLCADSNTEEMKEKYNLLKNAIWDAYNKGKPSFAA